MNEREAQEVVDVRERHRERERRRYREDHVYRERQLALKKARYASDAEFRQAMNEASLARHKKRYATDPEFRKTHNAKFKALETTERNRAKNRVHYALRTGKLVRPDHCEDCGKECKPDASHADYSKPLDVVWRCRSCHVKFDCWRKRDG